MRRPSGGSGTAASRTISVACQIALMWWPAAVSAAELPTLAGPAMGTIYRVTLAADIPGMIRGEVHREVEVVLARLDRAASTWRDDSDATRFNRAAAGEWVPVSQELVMLVEMAREVHAQSDGAFDITVVPAGSGRPTGMRDVVSRMSPPALRKSIPGIAIDPGGIGPGYAVDRIGERLVSLGSKAHLVELGGEVRAWGRPSEGRPWRVRLGDADAGRGSPQEIDLADGEAVATSTYRPGRAPIDPRTGRPVTPSRPRRVATVRAQCCAMADAWAVAALVLDLEPDRDGTITAPSMPMVPPAAIRPDP